MIKEHKLDEGESKGFDRYIEDRIAVRKELK
jgi:hypothetical protein